MKSGKKGETYNIGGNCEMENTVVVEMICHMLDERQPKANGKPRKELITFVKDRLGHDRRYAIDSTKLKEALGWMPEESFKSGLRKTIQWYMDHQDWVNRVKSGEYKSWISQHYG
jgi:dTDP-glucose 4,6-dehydratase